MCLGTCDNIQFSLGICVFYIPTNSMPIPIFSPDKGKLFKTFKGLKKKILRYFNFQSSWTFILALKGPCSGKLLTIHAKWDHSELHY